MTSDFAATLAVKEKGKHGEKEREANDVVSYLIFYIQGQSGLNMKNMPLKVFPTFPAIFA